MRQIGGGVQLHAHLHRRSHEGRDRQGNRRRKSNAFVQGSKEGERIKKIVNEGQLVPYELTVEVLINGMIANPAKVRSDL